MKEVEPSSGNVFADLDLPQAEEAFAKAKLAQRICAIIAERKLTQARAADLLGVDQPKVSALMRGKLAGFSTDRLFGFQCAWKRRRNRDSEEAPLERPGIHSRCGRLELLPVVSQFESYSSRSA